MVEAGTFSEAASLAAMTQANVSKHIKALEDQLGRPLFVRTHQGAAITEIGLKLSDYIHHLELLQSRFLADIRHGSTASPKPVSCAMPAACLMLPAIMTLCERQKENADTGIKLHLIPARKIIDRVMDGSIDVGISVERVDHMELHYQPLCKEEYVAAGAPMLNVASLTANRLLQCRFIYHPEFSFYFRSWCYHYFPRRRAVAANMLTYAGKANSINDALLMVLNGLGVSLFPRHCIEAHLRAGTLEEYTRPNMPCVYNDLYLVTLSRVSSSGAASCPIKRALSFLIE